MIGLLFAISGRGWRRPDWGQQGLLLEKVQGTGEVIVIGTTPEVVYLSVEMLEERGLVVIMRPSFRALVDLVIRRHLVDACQWVLRLAWRAGFLDVDAQDQWAAEHWTWAPWRTLRKRRRLGL